MTPSELIKLVIKLTSLLEEEREQHKADKAQVSSLFEKIDALTEELRISQEEARLLRLQLTDQNALLREKSALEKQLKQVRRSQTIDITPNKH